MKECCQYAFTRSVLVILLLTPNACASKFGQTIEADVGFFDDNTIASDAILKKSIISGSRPAEESMETLRDFLLQRLDVLHRIQQEIEPD